MVSLPGMSNASESITFSACYLFTSDTLFNYVELFLPRNFVTLISPYGSCHLPHRQIGSRLSNMISKHVGAATEKKGYG